MDALMLGIPFFFERGPEDPQVSLPGIVNATESELVV